MLSVREVGGLSKRPDLSTPDPHHQQVTSPYDIPPWKLKVYTHTASHLGLTPVTTLLSLSLLLSPLNSPCVHSCLGILLPSSRSQTDLNKWTGAGLRLCLIIFQQPSVVFVMKLSLLPMAWDPIRSYCLPVPAAALMNQSSCSYHMAPSTPVWTSPLCAYSLQKGLSFDHLFQRGLLPTTHLITI